jgi:hypothetical protein
MCNSNFLTSIVFSDNQAFHERNRSFIGFILEFDMSLFPKWYFVEKESLINWKQGFAIKILSQNKHHVLINTIINLNRNNFYFWQLYIGWNISKFL